MTPDPEPRDIIGHDLLVAAIQRQDDLRIAESRHVRQMATLQMQHDQEMRIAEAARVDAIRSFDVGAVTRAAEVATTQASALAAQVAAAASAATVALNTAFEPIQKDIADLRRAQYEAQGKGKQVAGLSTWIAVMIAAGGLVVGFLSLLAVVAVAVL